MRSLELQRLAQLDLQTQIGGGTSSIVSSPDSEGPQFIEDYKNPIRNYPSETSLHFDFEGKSDLMSGHNSYMTDVPSNHHGRDTTEASVVDKHNVTDRQTTNRLIDKIDIAKHFTHPYIHTAKKRKSRTRSYAASNTTSPVTHYSLYSASNSSNISSNSSGSGASTNVDNNNSNANNTTNIPGGYDSPGHETRLDDVISHSDNDKQRSHVEMVTSVQQENDWEDIDWSAESAGVFHKGAVARPVWTGSQENGTRLKLCPTEPIFLGKN